MNRLQQTYRKNAESLERMAAKAAETGRPVNGCLERELTAAAACYRVMSKAPAHVAEDMRKVGYARAMERLGVLRGEK